MEAGACTGKDTRLDAEVSYLEAGVTMFRLLLLLEKKLGEQCVEQRVQFKMGSTSNVHHFRGFIFST